MDQRSAHERRWLVLSVLVVCVLVVVLDTTIVNVALRTIQDDLGATQSQVEWVVNSYTLVFAGLLIAYGVLGDRVGHRSTMVFGLCVFGLASLWAAFSGSAGQLIAARSLMGVGAAAVMPGSMAMISHVFEPHERGRAIAVWASATSLAVVLGPVTGGLLLEHYWWGSIFLINVPVVVLAICGLLLLAPRSRGTDAQQLEPWPIVLSIGALVLIVYAIIKGGELGAFADMRVLGPFVVGLLLLGEFIVLERTSAAPMVDVRLFRNRVFSAANVAVSMTFFVLLGLLFVVGFYLQFVQGYGPLETGVRLAPSAVGFAVAAPVSTRLVERFGIRVVCGCGLGILVVTLLGYQLLDAASPTWQIAVQLLLQGIGVATVMAPATTAVLASVPPAKAGAASAVNNTMRQVGGALGVAVFGALVSARYRSGVEDAVSTLPLAADARHRAAESIGTTNAALEQLGAAGTVSRSAMASVSATAQQAFVTAMHRTTLVAALICLVGLLVTVRYMPGHRPAERLAEEQRDTAAELVGM